MAGLRCPLCRIKLHYNCCVNSIAFSKNTLSYTSESGSIQDLHYDLLLGCDGRNSAVREMLAKSDPSFKYETNFAGRSWKSFSQLPRLGKSLLYLTSVFYAGHLDRHVFLWDHCWHFLARSDSL